MPKRSKKRILAQKVKKAKVAQIAHTHYISLPIKSNLKHILKNDELDKFIELCGDHYVVNSKQINFTCKSNKDCVKYAGVESILYFNQGKIARYLINKNKINIHTMIMLIKLMKIEKSKIEAKKLFIDCMLYLNLPEMETATILNKLIILGDWDLTDLFHQFGYRSDDINNLVKYIPENKLEQICDLGYEFTNDGLLILIGTITKIKILRKLNITKELINAKSNRKQILSIYKKAPLNIIYYFERLFGFAKDSDCLDSAIKGLNFPVIYHLLDNNIKLEKNQLLMLLNLKPPDKKNKKSKKRKVIYRYRYRKLDKKIFGKKLCKDQDYDNNMIKFVNKYLPDNLQNIFDKSLSKATPLMIKNRCFALYDYLQKNYCFNCKIKQYDIDIMIYDMIHEDDIFNLKKLFDTKIILPIDISKNSNNMNYAISNNSTKMIEYFHTELDMMCNSAIEREFRYGDNHKVLIEHLEKLEYPINKNITQALCKRGKFGMVKHLLNKGYEIPSNVMTYVLLYNKYDMIDFFIEHNCQFKRKGMIDKVLALYNKEFRYSYGRRYNSQKIDISTSQINKLIQLECTATIKSTNILIKRGMFNLVVHLYNKFKIKPLVNSIIEYINKMSKWYSRQISGSDIKGLIYICENMGFDITEYIHSDMIIKLFGAIGKNNNIFNLLQYLIDKIKFEVSVIHLNQTLDRWCDYINAIKFFENLNVIPNKDTLLKVVNNRNTKAPEYLKGKYDLKLTIKDIHNMISSRQLNIYRWERYFMLENIKPTPYTIKLATDQFLQTYYVKPIKKLISCVGKITQESYDKIKNHNNLKIKNMLNKIKYEIVDYQVPDQEISDVEPYNDDSSDFSESDEDDVIDIAEQILRDVDIDGDIIDEIVMVE